MQKVKDFLLAIVVFIIWAAFFYLLVGSCTSAEVWYACTHDSKCETSGYGDCGCYDRFMERERAKK